MALSANARDYTWLVGAVALYMHRTDLTGRIPDFVMLAESRMNDDLDARRLTIATTLTTTAGVNTITLPDDLNSIRSLSVAMYGDIEYLAPDLLRDLYASSLTGYPVNYTVLGNTMMLGPVPDAVYALTMIYRQDVPALADNGGTNWLIQQHADVYLAATMCEALTYVRDQASLALWEGKYQAAITRITNTDWNASSPLTVRSDVRNR